MIIGDQLLRSGLSVGSHFREGIHSRSPAEFVAKLNSGLMEAEETLYWLETLEDSEVFSGRRLAPLATETRELSAILTTLIKRAKKSPRS